MELLGGQDLRALGKIDWRQACELLRDVASSLALLHSRRLVHGDVSPRNVRCTIDGRAKLLDFGAMMPMGVAKRVVGTPPFIAPEMLQLQPLDGRTDLYCARRARLLPAHRQARVSGAQRAPAARSVAHAPLTPIAIDPEIPLALSELVLELLQQNRNARPRSAGIAMERLCAIAALPFEEQADVAESYLTTPVLVGRETQLTTVHERLADAARGKAARVVARGPSGSGRSRFLDACVLDAKLLGCHVLRTDAGDAGAGATAWRARFRSACSSSRRMPRRAPRTCMHRCSRTSSATCRQRRRRRSGRSGASCSRRCATSCRARRARCIS